MVGGQYLLSAVMAGVTVSADLSGLISNICVMKNDTRQKELAVLAPNYLTTT